MLATLLPSCHWGGHHEKAELEGSLATPTVAQKYFDQAKVVVKQGLRNPIYVQMRGQERGEYGYLRSSGPAVEAYEA
jgi:hypothetical protein